MNGKTPPDELDETDLYLEYQHVKEHGPTARIDELQQEIARRWEQRVEKAHDFDVIREVDADDGDTEADGS